MNYFLIGQLIEFLFYRACKNYSKLFRYESLRLVSSCGYTDKHLSHKRTPIQCVFLLTAPSPPKIYILVALDIDESEK